MNRSYEELIHIPGFKERFEYLSLQGSVGAATFGSRRYLNQMLYRLPEWKSIRRKVILRDNACDLGHPDYEINAQPAYVHHINPISIDDIVNRSPIVFDINNLITTTFRTHQAIHYGDEGLLPSLPVERRPGDTCPWR